MSLERLVRGSELKSTLSIGKLFQRFMTRRMYQIVYYNSKMSRGITNAYRRLVGDDKRGLLTN